MLVSTYGMYVVLIWRISLSSFYWPDFPLPLLVSLFLQHCLLHHLHSYCSILHHLHLSCFNIVYTTYVPLSPTLLHPPPDPTLHHPPPLMFLLFHYSTILSSCNTPPLTFLLPHNTPPSSTADTAAPTPPLLPQASAPKPCICFLLCDVGPSSGDLSRLVFRLRDVGPCGCVARPL